MNDSSLKTAVILQVENVLNKRLATLTSQVQELQDALQSDTKSSAGDKHETAMAMAQLEQEQNQHLQDQVLKQLSIMQQPRWLEPAQHGGPGALITTDHGFFFIAIALGKIQVHDQTVTTLSMASPLGRQFEHCMVGQRVTMGNITLQILEIG